MRPLTLERSAVSTLPALPDPLPAWWDRAPQGARWQDVFRPVEAAAGTVWTQTDVLADFVLLVEGEVDLVVDGPLPSFRRLRVSPGAVFGGFEALADPVSARSWSLHGLRSAGTCRTAVRGWRLPQRRAFHQRDLDPLVAALHDEALLSFHRPELADLLDDLLGSPSADRGLAARLAEALSLRVLDAEAPLSLPQERLALVVAGGLVDEAGRRRPRGPLQAVDWKAWRGEELPRGRWVASERTLLATIGRDQVEALLAAAPPEDPASPYAALRRSPLWRRMPRDVPAEELFSVREVEAGQRVGGSSRAGWRLGEPGGELCFVVEGEVAVEHWLRGRALGARGVGPGGWLGGSSWLDPEVELLRMPEIVRYGFDARARTRCLLLVARPPVDRAHPAHEPLTRLIRERLYVECLRDALVQALRRNRPLAALPGTVPDLLLDRARLVRLPRGTELTPPPGEFFLFLRGELERHPGRDDRRRLFPPEPMETLSLTETLQGWAPVGRWEASSTCWLVRFRVDEIRAIRPLRRLLDQRRASGEVEFDKAGGAEIVLVHSDGLAPAAVEGLVDLLGQAIAADFQDRVLCVRLYAGPAGAPPAVQPQTATEPARVRLAFPARDALGWLAAHLRDWNNRYAWIVLLPEPGASAVVEQAVAPLVERLVVLTRDPEHLAEVPVTVDTATVTTVLLPDQPWRDRPRWRRGQPLHPGFPDGSVRLQVDGLLERLSRGGAPRLDELEPADRERIARWSRAVTDRRVALALGGGGAWGYVHVAMLHELVRRRVPVDLVSGSSFGAVVGAMYAAAGIKGLELLVAAGPLFGRTMPLNYLSTRALGGAIDGLLLGALALREEPPLPIPWAERPMQPEEARALVRQGVHGARRLLRAERGLQHRPVLHLEDLELPFFPVATDLDTGAEVVLGSGPVALGVRASGSFPGIFSSTPHPLDGRPLVDGGIASNVPDRVLSRQGAALIIASNPVPPPRPVDAASAWVTRLPLVRRVEQGVRSVYIMMHNMGQKDRRVVGAAYNSPPVEHGITEVARAREIVARSFRQDEFRDALHQAQQRWQQLSRPREIEARAATTARDERWTDLSRTGYAVVLPHGVDRDSPLVQALEPLLALRRAQVERRGGARYRELMGEEGVRPDETAQQLLRRLGLDAGAVEPEVMPYHVLLVGSPQQIPFQLQVELDLDYAVGRLWLPEVAAFARYARRVVAAEEQGVRRRPVLTLATAHLEAGLDRQLDEALVDPIADRLADQAHRWQVVRASSTGRQPPTDAAARVRGWFQGETAPDLLLYAGHTLGLHERRGQADPARAGRPYVARGRDLDPADFDPNLPLGPRVALLDGSYTGGWEAQPAYAFSELAPPRDPLGDDAVGPFSQALLDHPGGGVLAAVGKLDLAWLATDLRPGSPEPQALASVLELLLRGRTVGAAMQAMSDYYRVEAEALAAAGEGGDPALRERLRVCALNARSWVLLGDPAVRVAQD